MKAVLEDLPLRPTVAAALIVGLALPALLAAWLDVGERRQTLFDNLARDHVGIVETLANGMVTPIWDVRPDTARPLIEVIMGDNRVTAVSVTAPVLPRPLEAAKPEPLRNDTVALERPVMRDGQQIGAVRVEMTTAPLRAEAARQGWQAVLTALLQMAFGLLLIFPLIRLKVLAPLGRLVGQSQELAAGKLDQPFSWRRRDELGALGRSFEHTRRSLRTLFRDLEQRNSELRLSEADLARQTQVLRATLDNMTDGISLIDPDLRLVAWNDRFIEMFALPVNAVHEGQPIAQAHRLWLERSGFSPAEGASLARRLRAGFEPGKPFTLQIEPPGGTVVLLRRRPMPDGGFVTTYTDVTVQVHARRAADETLHLLEVVMDAVPAILHVKDRDLRYRFVNRYFLDLFGLQREQVLGRTRPEVMQSGWLPAEADRAVEVLERGEASDLYELPVRRPNGERIDMLGSKVPLLDGDGRATHVVTFEIDITEMKQAEEEIARQRDALHQADKVSALGSLLAGVAHELNNPLSVVVGRAAMLEAADLEPGVAAGVASIRTAAERCARIVRTFLAMARKQAPTRVPVRVADLVDGALDLLAYGLESAGIRVGVQVPPDLPQTMADPDQLAQVFNNLITNAQQALVGWSGRRELTIAAEHDRPGNQIRITVHDTGPGIADEVRGRIFDPFFTTKPAGSGTGVGLAVCRGIVEAHDGTIVATTAPGGGASFVVTLPIVAALPITGMVEGQGSVLPQHAPAPARPSGRVLIVEDEPEIRHMLSDILTADGHVVEEAANGREALSRLNDDRFDLVVSDLIMPGLDGPGLYEELRRRDPRMAERLLFITGDTLSTAARAFLERVDRPAIEKPFNPAEVRHAVRAALEARKPPNDTGRG